MSALPTVEMAVVDLSPVVTCACGREHDRYSWSTLRLCGYVGAVSDGDSQTLELRHCVCKSTIAREVTR